MKVECHKCKNVFDYDPPVIQQPRSFSSTFVSSFFGNGHQNGYNDIPLPKFFVTHCPKCNAEIQIPTKRL